MLDCYMLYVMLQFVITGVYMYMDHNWWDI